MKIKETRKLARRLHSIGQVKRSTPKIKLDNPIRHGWARTFVLREDLKWRSDAKVLQRQLERINTTEVCMRKDFLRRDYETKKMVPIEQELRFLNKHQYEDLPELEKKLFSQKVVFKKNYLTKKLEEVHEWHYNSPDIFVYRIRPNFITEVPALYPDLEGEEKKIDDKLYGQKDYYKYLHEGCSCCGDDNKKKKIKEHILDREMKEEI